MRFWKQEKPALDPNNRTVINVWLPKWNGVKTTAIEFVKAHLNQQTDQATSRIGHVSIETPNKYASWWPDPTNDEQVSLFNVINSQNSTYANDCKSEDINDGNNGMPDLKICLFSLDIDKIEDCFDNIENSKYGYVLSGDKKITRLYNEDKGQSCSGLAYELLVAGGILNLSSIYMDLKAKWLIVTPDNLAQLLKNAKAEECKAYPESINFIKISNEYLPVTDSSESQSCTLL